MTVDKQTIVRALKFTSESSRWVGMIEDSSNSVNIFTTRDPSDNNLPILVLQLLTDQTPGIEVNRELGINFRQVEELQKIGIPYYPLANS